MDCTTPGPSVSDIFEIMDLASSSLVPSLSDVQMLHEKAARDVLAHWKLNGKTTLHFNKTLVTIEFRNKNSPYVEIAGQKMRLRELSEDEFWKPVLLQLLKSKYEFKPMIASWKNMSCAYDAIISMRKSLTIRFGDLGTLFPGLKSNRIDELLKDCTEGPVGLNVVHNVTKNEFIKKALYDDKEVGDLADVSTLEKKVLLNTPMGKCLGAFRGTLTCHICDNGSPYPSTEKDINEADAPFVNQATKTVEGAIKFFLEKERKNMCNVCKRKTTHR